jgi:hypothetical protein
MKLKKYLTALALTVAASAALAQPTPPASPPVSGAPPEGTISGNSGLILSVWDSTRNVSLTEYLGVSLNDFANTAPLATLTPNGGLTLDFGQMGGSSASSWATVFGASTAANVQWMVTGYEGDSTDGVAAGMRLLTTSNGSLTASVNNTLINAAGAADSFYAILAQQAAGQPCAEGNPCVATSNSAADYAGKSTWGNKLSGALPAVATATLGNSLGFYLLSGTSSGSGSSAAVVQRFKNAANNAYWLLSATGHLIYQIDPVSSVPLPAAVWLLLSGLAGVGVVGRRRAA